MSLGKKRKVFKCGLYNCVVAFHGGKFQGVARLPDKGIIFRVAGVDLEDAEEKLIDLIKNNSLVFNKNHFYCIVALSESIYDGVIYLQEKEIHRTTSDSIQATKNILIKYIEENGESIIFNHLREAHQNLLRSRNVKNYKEIGITLSPKRHRTANCFRCKSSLDNFHNHECNSCGWILCMCGACGCSYMKFS